MQRNSGVGACIDKRCALACAVASARAVRGQQRLLSTRCRLRMQTSSGAEPILILGSVGRKTRGFDGALRVEAINLARIVLYMQLYTV